MAAIILPTSIENELSELRAAVTKLQNARPQISASGAAMTLLNSGAGSGAALTTSFVAVTGTNVAFTSGPGGVLVIGSATLLSTNTGAALNASACVGVAGQVFAQLQKAAFSLTPIGTACAMTVPITSVIAYPTLPPGSYTAQWQGIYAGFGAALDVWSTFIFQLGVGSPGFS
jgi:hypothetical protein